MRKIFIALLIAVTAFAFQPQVEAAITSYQNIEHYHPAVHNSEFKIVKANTVAVKEYPSNNSKTVATVKKDERIIVSGELKAGWIYAQARDYSWSGYVNNNLLTETIAYGYNNLHVEHIAKVTADHVVKNEEGKVLNTIQKDSLVRVFDSFNPANWRFENLSLRKEQGNADARYLQIISPTIRQANVKGGVLLRERPSPSAKVIGTVPQQIALASYGQVAGGWRVVVYGDYIGFVPANVMQAAKPVKRYVAAEGLPVYEKASRSAKVGVTLAQGVQVDAYPGTGGWSYVRIHEIEGYVPTQFLVEKKPAKTKSPYFPGLKIDARTIKPHITATDMFQANGKKMYVHMSRFGLGVQQAGSQAIYFQVRAGNSEMQALAKQLTKDVGQFMSACEVNNICQFVDGELKTIVADDGAYVQAAKRIDKGTMQVASRSSSEYEGISFTTYRFNNVKKRFEYVNSKYYSEFSSWAEGVRHLERFKAEPNYFVK